MSDGCVDRIRWQCEICFEGVVDWFATTPLRKPLMALAAIAVFLTFKNGRSSVRRSRAMGWLGGGSRSAVSSSLYGSTFGRSVKSSPPYPAGAGAAAVGGGGNLPYGNQQQQQHPGTMYGGQQQQQQAVGGQLGGQVGYGNTLGAYGANAAGGTYGNQGIAARPMGTAPGAQAGGYGASTGTVMGGGGGLPPPSSSSSSMGTGQGARATADLVDANGAAVSIMETGLLKDYGGVGAFTGQIETIQAFEAAGLVEQVLNTPGEFFCCRRYIYI